MDFLKKIKQKACQMTCDHLASTKPARLVFFAGDAPSQDSGEDLQHQIDTKEAEAAEHEGLSEELADEFQVLNVMLETARQKDGVNEQERENIEDMLTLLVQKQIDERLNLMEDSQARIEQTDEAEEDNPAEDAETIPTHLIEFVEIGGTSSSAETQKDDWLENILADLSDEYGREITIEEVKEHNPGKIHYNKKHQKHYYYQTASIRVPVGTRETVADLTADERAPDRSVDTFTDENKDRAERVSEAREQERDQQDNLVPLRAALVSGGLAGRADRLEGLNLSRQEKFDLTFINESNRALFETRNFSKWQKLWEDTEGHGEIKRKINQTEGPLKNLTVEKYHKALLKGFGKDTDLSMRHLIDAAYTGADLVESMLDQPLPKSVRKKLKGNSFTNDYDRLLTSCTIEQTSYNIIDGKLFVGISKSGDDTVESISVPVDLASVIDIDEDSMYHLEGNSIVDDLGDVLADSPTEIEEFIASHGGPKALYMGPEGNLRDLAGQVVTSKENLGEFGIAYTYETLALQAMESIYAEVGVLYDMTAQLRYAPRQEDALDQDTIFELREGIDPEGPEGTFHTLLTETYRSNKSQKLVSRYMAKGQVTYTDIESGVTFSRRKEEFEQNFDGNYVFTDIFRRFSKQEVDQESGEIVEVFDEAGALEFMYELMEHGLIREAQALQQEDSDYEIIHTEILEDLEGLKVDSMTDLLEDPEKWERYQELLREGYFAYALMRHAIQTTPDSPSEDAEAEPTSITETPLNLMPKEVIEETIQKWREQKLAADPEYDLEQDEQILREQLTKLSVGMGMMRTVNYGTTKTVHQQLDVDGNVVQSWVENHCTTPTTCFCISRLAIGVSHTFQMSDNQSFTLGLGGMIDLRAPQNVNLGATAAYSISSPQGFTLTMSAGAGAQVGADGINLGLSFGIRGEVPLGPVKLGAEANVILVGGVVPIGVTTADLSANVDWTYRHNLGVEYERLGYDEVEALISEGANISEISEAILEIEEFEGLEASYQLFKHQVEEKTGSWSEESASGFDRFILDIYQARRHEVAGNVLDGSTPKVLEFSKIGGGVIWPPCGFPPIPVFFATLTVANIPLVYRTTNGINYEALSDQEILRQFDAALNSTDPESQVDLTANIAEFEIPKMVSVNRRGFETDEESPQQAYVRDRQMSQGFATQRVDKLNQAANSIDVNFKPTKFETVDGRQTNLLEMQVLNVPGNLELVIDPALEDRMHLLYDVGNDVDKPDRFFLAAAPDVSICLKRQDFYYPFQEEGEQYARTVITITENPLLSRGQLRDFEHAPYLEKRKGSHVVEDAAQSEEYFEGTNNTRSLTEFLYASYGNREAWEQAEHGWIENIDQAMADHITTLGEVDLSQAIPEDIPEEITSVLNEEVAESLVSPSSSTDTTFRADFRRLSTVTSRHGDNQAELEALVRDRCEKLLGRELTDEEDYVVQYFKQLLNNYSFVDIESRGPEKQKAAYEHMTETFTRPMLLQTFASYSNAEAMADRVIDQLNEQLDFTQPGSIPSEIAGAIFGSYVGTGGEIGTRVLEYYDKDHVYGVLNLVEFSIDSSDPIERDISQAIVDTLNPSVEMTPQNIESVMNFLTDDFAQRVSLAWYLKDVEDGQTLLKMITAARDSYPEGLQSMLDEPANLALLEQFQTFVRRARAIETAPQGPDEAPRRLKITEGFYLSFQSVEMSFAVFKRCGNVSRFLNERLIIQNTAGEPIALEDESHRLIKPKNSTQNIGVGMMVSFETEICEDTDYEQHEPEPEPEQPEPGMDETGSEYDGPDSGGRRPGSGRPGSGKPGSGKPGSGKSKIELGDGAPEESDGEGAPMG